MHLFKQRYFAFLLLLLCAATSQAQSTRAELRALADRVIYLDESNTDSFLIYSQIIENQSNEINYQRGLCDSYRLRGIYHECRAEYDQAIEWHLKNLQLSEQLGERESELAALSDLATQHHYLRQYEQAKAYLHRAIKMGLQTGAKPRRMSTFYTNLGIFHRETGQPDSALHFYTQSLAIKRELKDSSGISNVMVNIATLLIDQKKYDAAQPYVDFNLSYHQRKGDTVNLWFDHLNQSIIYLGKNQFRLSEQQLNLALAVARKIPSRQKESETYRQFAILSENMGDYKNAYQYLQRYQQLNAESINVETNKNVAELREKYESDKREQQNKLLSLEIEAQKAQKRNLGIIIGLIALLAGLAVFAWWKNHQKRKLLTLKNAELEAEKAKLENTLQRLHQMREQLMHSEKMASIGQLTAGIAHEINNPINFVGSSIQALKMNLADLRAALPATQNNALRELYEEAATLMASIERGIDRTRDIVLGLRTFARNDDDALSPTDLHACLDAALSLLQYDIKNRCRIVRDYGEIPLVQGLAGKLNQLFLNLFNNAVQAIQVLHPESATPKGLLEIRTRRKDNAVEVLIRDNGCGMDEATRKRIFEPFFTTKAVGEGTGLGMAICYGIVQQHGASITIESAPRQGATVQIIFPDNY